MAIIDRNSILFEGPLTASGTGPAVALNALKLPGRMEPMPLRLSVTQGFKPEEVQSLTIGLEEADTASGPWTSVAGATVSVSHTSENPALAAGSRPYQRFLPQGMRKGWLRLTFALTPVSGKSVTQGSIFAALLREEDLPYEKALMVG